MQHTWTEITRVVFGFWYIFAATDKRVHEQAQANVVLVFLDFL